MGPFPHSVGMRCVSFVPGHLKYLALHSSARLSEQIFFTELSICSFFCFYPPPPPLVSWLGVAGLSLTPSILHHSPDPQFCGIVAPARKSVGKIQEIVKKVYGDKRMQMYH
jgi:hypothetical protein